MKLGLDGITGRRRLYPVQHLRLYPDYDANSWRCLRGHGAASITHLLALTGRDAAGRVTTPILPKGRVPMKNCARWLIVPVLLAATVPAAAQTGDWTTYGGNDWNQRYSTLKTITTSNVGQLVPRMMFQTGITKLGSFENTPIVSNGNHVRHHPVQHRDGVRSEYEERALALRAQAGHHHHLLRPEQPRCRHSRRSPRVHGHPRRPPDRLRRKDRQSDVGQGSSRPDLRLQHHARAARHRRQRDRRRLWRRVRHSRTRHRVQRRDRRAGVALVLDSRAEWRSHLRRQGPGKAGSAVGRRAPPMEPTCIATSPRKRATAPSTPMPGRPAAAASG